jgi:hypothetical protein
LTNDDLILLRTIAAHGGIAIGRVPGRALLQLQAAAFIEIGAMDAQRARATVTVDGLRALAFRFSTQGAATIAVTKLPPNRSPYDDLATCPPPPDGKPRRIRASRK